MLAGAVEAEEVMVAEVEEADLVEVAEEAEVEAVAEDKQVEPPPLTPATLAGATHQLNGERSQMLKWTDAGKQEPPQLPEAAQQELWSPLKSQKSLQQPQGVGQASQGLEVEGDERPSVQYGSQQSLT